MVFGHGYVMRWGPLAAAAPAADSMTDDTGLLMEDATGSIPVAVLGFGSTRAVLFGRCCSGIVGSPTHKLPAHAMVSSITVLPARVPMPTATWACASSFDAPNRSAASVEL